MNVKVDPVKALGAAMANPPSGPYANPHRAMDIE